MNITLKVNIEILKKNLASIESAVGDILTIAQFALLSTIASDSLRFSFRA